MNTMKYTIAPNDKDGYTLTLWEPAPQTETRLKPYLFRVSLSFALMDEAIDYLGRYQQLNQQQVIAA